MSAPEDCSPEELNTTFPDLVCALREEANQTLWILSSGRRDEIALAALDTIRQAFHERGHPTQGEDFLRHVASVANRVRTLAAARDRNGND